MCGLQAGRAPRYGARAGADAEDLGLRALEDDRDVGRILACAARDGREEVEDARTAVSAVWTSMNPAPPGPVSGLSVAHEANPAATQASTAFPPRSRIRAPTSAVSGWPAAIAPFMD